MYKPGDIIFLRKVPYIKKLDNTLGVYIRNHRTVPSGVTFQPLNEEFSTLNYLFAFIKDTSPAFIQLDVFDVSSR